MFPGTYATRPPNLCSIESVATRRDPTQVVAAIRRFLHDHRITLFDIYNHSQEARHADLDLEDTRVVVFGDPRVGTALMQQDRRVALDLPLKMLVWRQGGTTRIGYKRPSVQFEHCALTPEGREILCKMDALLSSAASSAAGTGTHEA